MSWSQSDYSAAVIVPVNGSTEIDGASSSRTGRIIQIVHRYRSYEFLTRRPVFSNDCKIITLARKLN